MCLVSIIRRKRIVPGMGFLFLCRMVGVEWRGMDRPAIMKECRHPKEKSVSGNSLWAAVLSLDNCAEKEHFPTWVDADTLFAPLLQSLLLSL